jgi:VWFA-related protein
MMDVEQHGGTRAANPIWSFDVVHRVRSGLGAKEVLACILLACLAPLHGQTSTPAPAAQVQQQGGEFTLKTFSRLTLVDVTVTDGKGQPVHSLPETAFTVLEDGKPQPIRSFIEVGKNSVLAAPTQRTLPPHVYTNLQPAPTTSAVNVLLLDGLNTDAADQIFVKDETIRYLKSMPAGTRIAIMSLGAKLRLLQGFTSDPAILLAAIDSKKSRSLPSPFLDTDSSDALDSQMDAADADAASAIQEFQGQQASFMADIRNRMTLEALDQITAYLSGIKGRKNLIWFTAGIPLQMFPQGGVNDLATMTDYSKDIRKTTDLMTAAQIAVYPVDARGLMTNPVSVINPPAGFANGRGDAMGKVISSFGMKTAQEHLGMVAVAEATGGEAYFNTNGLKEAVGKAINSGQNYYSISYVPPDPAFDGVFHKITIKLNGLNWKLSYRKGYYADDVAHNQITPGITLATTAPEPYGNNMASSMGRGVPTSSQILFTARIVPQIDTINPPDAKIVGTIDPKLQQKPLRRYTIQYSLPGRQVTFNQGPDGTRKGALEFDIAAYDVFGKSITSLSQTIDLSLSSERYKQLQTKPYQVIQAIDLPLGEVFLRVGVLDTISDKTGTMEIPLTVNRKPNPPSTPVAENTRP